MATYTRAIATPPGQPTKHVRMSDDEVAQLMAQREEFAARQAAAAQAENDRKAAKVAASARLKASGLTEQQIADILLLAK